MQCLRHLRLSMCRRSLPSVTGVQPAVNITVWSEQGGDEYAARNRADRPSFVKQVITGAKLFPDECVKWTEEMVDKVVQIPILSTFHGDYESLYKFNNHEAINSWSLTTDRSMMEGTSQAEFLLGPKKIGMFRGFLNTTVPKDGQIKRSGYCNIRSPAIVKSFQRLTSHDWSLYTHLVMKVRGDGRPYQIQLSMERYFDVHWSDQYIYTLFTRGGPYWQIAHIPFSKFFLAAKGSIQDEQEPLQLDQIQNIGLTLGDGATGAFQLEVDYIAVIKDIRHEEDFAYEMYETNSHCTY